MLVNTDYRLFFISWDYLAYITQCSISEHATLVVTAVLHSPDKMNGPIFDMQHPLVVSQRWGSGHWTFKSMMEYTVKYSNVWIFCSIS